MAHKKTGKTQVPCFVCAKELDDFANDGGNQPIRGTEFHTSGHYGSAVTDFMDGTYTIVNICDDCLRDGIKAGRVMTLRNGDYEPWEDTHGQP